MDFSCHKELLIATQNKGKLREISYSLSDLPLKLRTSAEYPNSPEVEETGKTFAENAVLKARQLSQYTGLLTLADDSGLEVEALGGEPGIFSARYGGRNKSDHERDLLLLKNLARKHPGNRRARFVCAIALAAPKSGAFKIFHGVCAGNIAIEPRGEHGFGYDPVFIPEGSALTFGQLPESRKRQISHRSKAVAALRDFLSIYYPVSA